MPEPKQGETGPTSWPVDIVPPERALSRRPRGKGRLGEDVADCLFDRLLRERADRVIRTEPQVGHPDGRRSRQAPKTRLSRQRRRRV